MVIERAERVAVHGQLRTWWWCRVVRWAWTAALDILEKGKSFPPPLDGHKTIMQAARRLCQVENMKNFYISMKSNVNAIGNV